MRIKVMDITYQEPKTKTIKMTLREVRNLRDYSEKMWSHLFQTIQPKIVIENDINGTYESETTYLGSRVKRFKPWTNHRVWSSWRVGIPVRWKGKTLMLWCQGYTGVIEPKIVWLEGSIWNVDTNKPLRSDAATNCWRDMIAGALKSSSDVDDIHFSRRNAKDITKGWKINHKGHEWETIPEDDGSRGYWVRHRSSGRYAKKVTSLKGAKAFIKFDAGGWLSEREV
jgi:hypothetical protein